MTLMNIKKGVRLTRTPWGIIPGYVDLRVAQRLTPTRHQVEEKLKNMLIKIYVLLYIKYLSDKPLLLPQEAMGFNCL